MTREAIPDSLLVEITPIGAASIGESVADIDQLATALGAERIREMYENGKP